MKDLIVPSIIARTRLAAGALLLASAPTLFFVSNAQADTGGAAASRFVYRQGRDRQRAYPMRTFRQRLHTNPVRHQVAHQILAARSVMTQAEQAARDFGETGNTYRQNDAVRDAVHRISLAVQDLSDGLRQATPAERPALVRAQRSIVRRAQRVHATLNQHLLAQGRSVLPASVALLQSLQTAIDSATTANVANEATLPSEDAVAAFRAARHQTRTEILARVNEIEEANPATTPRALVGEFSGARSFHGALRSLRRMSPSRLGHALRGLRAGTAVTQREVAAMTDLLNAQDNVERARYVFENNPSMQATRGLAAVSQAFQHQYDRFLNATLGRAATSRGGDALGHLADIAAAADYARDWDRGGDRP